MTFAKHLPINIKDMVWAWDNKGQKIAWIQSKLELSSDLRKFLTAKFLTAVIITAVCNNKL